MRARLLLLALAGSMISVPVSVDASLVYGIQATTGRILTINPTSGAVVNTFSVPSPIEPTQGNAGLTYAAPLGEILYLDHLDFFSPSTLYRLDATTGVVLSTAPGDRFGITGLSYQKSATGEDLIFYAHAMSPPFDVHRQDGFGGATTWFWGPNPHAAGPSLGLGGLGGDGYGRLFGLYRDGFIGEINPFDNVNSFITRFAAPEGALGLAFDGVDLFVSTTDGQLLTMNPNTGTTLRSVFVAGGTLLELGAKAPEPGTIALLGLGFAGLAWTRKRKRR